MKFEPALEEEMTCREMSLNRVNSVIRHYDAIGLTDDANQALAYMVADILHYCKHHSIDLKTVIDEAEMYVSEDESLDAELTK